MSSELTNQNTTAKIQLLDANTINKIAAGEVVERPASVVKELIENAIDAGASDIEVEIADGGVSFIRVTDNGSGMERSEAELAVQRHATSKIRMASDLLDVATLGFRGEALPTIASVSRFAIITRTAYNDLGTKVAIDGGKETSVEDIGCNIGTTVRVEDLFFNTPARKKFLKTNQTEAGKINEFIVKLALSRPDIAFRFINNAKLTLNANGVGDLAATVAVIYGDKVGEALLPIEFSSEDIAITGYITKPSLIKSSRSWQTYIINKRIIQNRAIAKAVDNAYRALVPKMGFPLTVLNIAVPQRSIDVNVHPQKTELKFADESRVFKAVYKAVTDAVRPEVVGYGDSIRLQNIAAAVERPSVSDMPNYENVRLESLAQPAVRQEREFSYDMRVPVSDSYPQTVHEATTKLASGSFEVSFAEAQLAIQAERSAEYHNGWSTASQTEATDVNLGSLLPIGQVDLTYIIAQTVDTLYIIDQHAAHERILFDKFSAMADGIPSQQLLVHQVLSFDDGETVLIDNNSELFSKLGFQLVAAGGRDFRLVEVPADIPVAEAEGTIREILASLGELHQATPQQIRQACLAMTACRAAIKAGEELNLRQMQILLAELSRTPFPYTCPHGRPTILKFTSHDLAKMFKRTGF